MASTESKASWCLVSPVNGVGDKRVLISGTFWAGRLARSTQLAVVSASKLSATIDVDQIADEQVDVELLQTSVDALQTEIAFKGTSNAPWLKFDFINALAVEQLFINNKPYESGKPIVDDPGAIGLYEFKGILKLQPNTTAGELPIELTVSGSTQSAKSTSSAVQEKGDFTYQLVPVVKKLLNAAGESVVCSCTYDTYLNGSKIASGQPQKDFYLTSSNNSVFVVNTHEVVVQNNMSTQTRSTILTFSQPGFVDATIEVVQEAGKMVYEAPIVNVKYTTIPAAGGTATPAVAYQQTWTWNGVKDSGSTINRGASITWSMQDKEGFKLNVSNGYVTADNNKSEEARQSEPVLCTVKLNGKTTVFDVVVAQVAGKKMFLKPVIGKFEVDDIPASGGSITAARLLTYTQTWTWNGVKDSGGFITTGANVVYSEPVVAPSLEAIAKERSIVGLLSVTVKLNELSSTKAADIYQALNRIESYNEVVCNKFEYVNEDNTDCIIPAGGGQSVAPTVELAQGRLWSSGYLETVEADIEIVKFVLSVDDYGTFKSIDAKTGIVSADTLGSRYLKAHSASLRLDVKGLDGSELSFDPTKQLYQEANYVESFTIEKFAVQWSKIAPNATQSAEPNTTEFKCKFTYRSKTITETAPADTDARLDVVDEYTLTKPVSGFNMIDSQTGVLSVDKMGTQLGDRVSADIEVNRTVSIEPLEPYQALPQPQATSTIFVKATQGTNSVVFSDIDVHATYEEMPAAGGTLKPVLLYKQTATYASDTVVELTSNAVVKWSGDNVNVTTGEVSLPSLGIVATPRRVATVSIVEVSLNGKTSTLATDVWQAENMLERWGVPELMDSNPYTDDIPAKGGEMITGHVNGWAKQIAYWSSNAEELHENIKFDSPASWGQRVFADSLLLEEKPRTKVGVLTYNYTVNGVKGVTPLDVYQAANFPNYDAFAIEAMGSNVIPASGGSVQIQGIKHFTWESESESTEDIQTGFVLQWVDTSAGFSIDMSNDMCKVVAGPRQSAAGDTLRVQVKATCENIEAAPITIEQSENTMTLKSISARFERTEISPEGGQSIVFVDALYAYSSGIEANSDVSALATLEFDMQSVPAYLSISNNYVNAANQTNKASQDVEVALTVKFETATTKLSGLVIKANTASYGPINGKLMASKKVPAGGDNIQDTLTYVDTSLLSQERTWLSGTTEVVDNRPTVVSKDPSTIEIPSLGTTIKDSLAVFRVTLQLEWNGVTASKYVDIFQQENKRDIDYSTWVIQLTAPDPNIPCYGGKTLVVKSASRVRTDTYTSGAVEKFDEHSKPNGHTMLNPFYVTNENDNTYVNAPDILLGNARQANYSVYIANWQGPDSKASITIYQAAYPGVGEMEIGLTTIVR